jgi:hypothetical protein
LLGWTVTQFVVLLDRLRERVRVLVVDDDADKD